MTPTRYYCLADEIAKLKPNTILEVGTHNGRSASIMLEEAVKHKPNVKYCPIIKRISNVVGNKCEEWPC